MKAYVYMVSNPVMPGLVKIGYTSRPLHMRLHELSNNPSIPVAFDLDAYWECDDKHDANAWEEYMHGVFAEQRIEGSEFFTISAAKAVLTLPHKKDLPAYISAKTRTEMIKEESRVQAMIDDIGKAMDEAENRNAMV